MKKACVQCGNEFLPRHFKQTVCSDTCVKNRGLDAHKRHRLKIFSLGLCREGCGRARLTNSSKCQKCIDKDAQRRREMGDSDPRFYMFCNARTRAKEQGIPFRIIIDDIFIPKVCPIFGIELKRSRKVISDSSPTLDRIIPNLGYIPGNIVVMSRKANRLKNNASLDEMILLGKWAEKQKRQ